MSTDTELDASVRRVLSQILAAGAPHTALPLVDPTTKLLPAPTVDAIRAPLEAHVDAVDAAVQLHADALTELTADVGSLDALVGPGGRLGEQALNATIAGGIESSQYLIDTFARRTPGITLMGLGDSQTANGGHTLANPASSMRGSYYYGDPAWHLFAQILSDGKFDHIGNAATGGYTIQQIKATHLPAALRIRPKICVVLAGENNKSTLSAQDLVDLASIYDALTDAGITAILCTIPPTSTIENVYKLNAWIRRQARLRGLPLADLHAALVDRATGGWKAGTNQDASHPNASGAMLMGAELARVLAPILRAGDPDLADDEISAGSLTPKPLFLTHSAGTSADNLPGSSGTPPFPSSGWAASTTFASGAFSFADAETIPEGRYFRGHRIAGVDNWFATSNWTLGEGHLLRMAFGVDMTIPTGGKIEMFLLGPTGWATTPFRAVFTQSIKGTIAFEFPIIPGQSSYAGFKFQVRLTGADGTTIGIKRWTARDLTALGAA